MKQQLTTGNNEVSQPDSPSVKGKKDKQSLGNNGWYRVERITGHRLNTEGKRTKLEFRVKWEGHAEQTWEAFDGFVKDATPLVERYLISKVCLPLKVATDELKTLKTAPSTNLYTVQPFDKTTLAPEPSKVNTQADGINTLFAEPKAPTSTFDQFNFAPLINAN